MMKNIVLIGFMGSGKTTTGKVLKEKTDMTFVDTDELIEAYEGCKISEVFADKGEAYFRRLENETLKNLLSSTDNKVISTGGGIVTNKENIPLLKQLGKVFYLRIKPERCMDSCIINRCDGITMLLFRQARTSCRSDSYFFRHNRRRSSTYSLMCF